MVRSLVAHCNMLYSLPFQYILLIINLPEPAMFVDALTESDPRLFVLCKCLPGYVGYAMFRMTSLPHSLPHYASHHRALCIRCVSRVHVAS